MNLSLQTKVTLFIAAVVIAISAVSTSLFVSVHKKSMERETIARGFALNEALSRAVANSLASENLELIKQVQDIVHTRDVTLAQVYTTLWLAVDAYPREELDTSPDSAAVEHFKKSEDDYYRKDGEGLDFYSSVHYRPFGDAGNERTMLIGYVRLKLSTENINRAISNAVIANIVVSALLTIAAILILNLLMRQYVLKPILALHASVSKHRDGEFPETIPVYSGDEIGGLSTEFNLMSRTLREREVKLAEEKERLAVTLRSIGDAVIVTDVDGTITLLNKVAEHLTGWTMQDAVGKPLSEVFHIINEKTRERCEHPVANVINTGLICGLANHTVLVRRDGAELIIEDSAAPIRDRESRIIGVVLVFRDTTEKRRMEDELIKVEKLESVGVLAGGLAHDFNNLLTAILGNISMAKMYIDGGNKAFARLTEAESASKRASELTYQLLTFSRGGAPIRKTASIGDIVRESARFTLSGTSVAAEYSIGSDIWSVDVDAGQMSQVFSNLIINAVQAMPSGGTVTITAKNVVLGADDVPTLESGTYVRISIGDRGIGIPDELLPRIFDPYFTTKQTGSGLGLASVYSIIKKHDGHITVESKSGQGTTFRIYLPASGDKLATQTAQQGEITKGIGRILVMDDERIVRDISGEMLRSLGYESDFAINGAEAVEIYLQALKKGRPYHAVIMDLTIPGGMGGREAITELRSLDPDVRVIVSSGYSNDPIMADFKTYGFRGVIIKPYSIDLFSKTLREVLE